jgi:diadenosine tetraphosphatase ApaH/serine/threonine PP2A family protein phosphatase
MASARRSPASHSTERVEIDKLGPVLFCHATPASDNAPFTVASADDRVRSFFADLAEAVVVCGHTHMQFERTVDRVRIVNAGSVGMPYDDEPGARWPLSARTSRSAERSTTSRPRPSGSAGLAGRRLTSSPQRTS